MKKFLKYLFIFLVLVLSVFVKNLSVSNEIVASANSAEAEFLAMFSDNENLEKIQSTSLTKTYFNVLDEVDYEFYDQDQYGACYAFSLAQMLNLSYEYKTGEHIRLSALALALQFEDVFFDDGSYVHSMLQNSFDIDYVSEYDFPYELAKMYYDEKITTKQLNLNFDDKEIIDIKEYYLFPEIEQSYSTEAKNLFIENMKKALVLDGALAVSFSYSIASSGDYLIYEPMVESKGGHALTIVGFDDSFSGEVFGHQTDGAFIVMNSWGAHEQFIYMSYEDVTDLWNVLGVAGFIDTDERAESISNTDATYYGFENGLYAKEIVDDELEIGYLMTNKTKNSYLSQIDLKPLCRDIDLYGFSADIKLYIGASTWDLTNGSFEYIGDFDISGGVNKIVLQAPIEVSKNFSIKIEIIDDEHRFSFLEESNLNFPTYYNNQGNWLKFYYSDFNYDLIKTPYYVKAVFTDGTNYDISEEDNHQTNTANEVKFDLTSSANTEITDVGVEVFRKTTANASFSSFSMTEENVTNEFNIDATTSSVSLTKTAFSQGTYKVVININDGEKQFIKYLFFDDGIDVFSFYSYVYYDIFEKANDIYPVYSNSLSADVVNITIPDAYSLYYVKNKAFLMEDIFNYNQEEIEISAKYSIDTSERISKAEVTFKNIKTSATRVVTFNFIYDKANLIFYVTKLASATHSNYQTINEGFGFYLLNASAPNHTFLGWYADEEFTTLVSKINAVGSGQIIYVYAKFEEKTMPNIVQKISYDEENNILSVQMDFSDYNLAIYDSIRFSSILCDFKTMTLAEPFHLLKSAIKNNKYEYKINISPDNMKAINTISFEFKAQRWKYRGKYGFYSTLTQNVSITDNVRIIVTKIGNGKIYNSLTGDLIESGEIYLPYGAKLDMNFVPEFNHQIKRILVDGLSIISTDEYCFMNLTKNHTFEIEFELITYEISALVSGEGELDKGLIELVERGKSITYTFVADEGYFLQSLQVDGVSLPTEGVTSYTFSNVQENHSINIVFAPYYYTITANVIGSGSIGHSNVKTVEYGADVVYTFTPSEGYHLKQIIVDGEAIPLSSNYSFENVTANHTLIVKFEKDVINVSLIVSGNGQIRVKNNQTGSFIGNTKTETSLIVEYEDDLYFEFVGDNGYKVGSAIINGTTYDSVDSLLLTNVIDDIEVEVYFVVKTYNLKLVLNGSGVANLPSNVLKNHGESLEYIFTPSKGYEIDKVIVDGVNKGSINSYSFENIASDHVINVVFVIQSFEIKWFNYNGMIISTTIVNYGISPTPTFSNPTRPDDGNYVYDFTGWNSEIDGSGFGVVPATSDMNYYAQFYKHLVSFAIKVGVSSNGMIYPQGNDLHNVMVEYGKNQTFEFVPNIGYHVSKVYVDDKSIENLESYTFENVTESHTISVVFKRNDFKSTIISDDEKGTISGSTWFENGERATYKITPNDGYIIESVFVNGKKVKVQNNTIVIENVTSDVEIVVNYISKIENSTFANFTKSLILGGIGIAVLGLGFAVVYAVKLKRKNKAANEDDTY